MAVTTKKIVESLIITVITGIIIALITKYIRSIGKLKPIVKGQSYRDCDKYGCGNFGASRSGHVHKGLDIVSNVGQEVKSPISGTVTRYPRPYADDSRYNGIEIKNDKYLIKIFYVDPIAPTGSQIRAGALIGYAQNISAKYGAGMTNHVHIEVYSNTGAVLDPALLFA